MKRAILLMATTAAAASACAGVAVGQAPLYALLHDGCPATSNNIVGTEGNDLRGGTPMNDLMLGFGGHDLFEAESGDDCLVMGTGIDRGNGNDGNDALFWRGRGRSPEWQRRRRSHE